MSHVYEKQLHSDSIVQVFSGKVPCEPCEGPSSVPNCCWGFPDKSRSPQCSRVQRAPGALS